MNDRATRDRRSTERRGWVLALIVMGIVVGSQVLAHVVVDSSLGALSEPVEVLVEGAILAVVDGFLVWRLVIGPLERRRALADFDARLGRAFEMALTEQHSYAVVERVLAGVPKTRHAELLIADSSEAHLKSVVAVGQPGLGCQVVSPHHCPAVRKAQTLVFDASDSLDSCPELRGRPGCSAVCVPVNIMGKAIGVVHIVGEAHAAPARYGSRLESLAGQAGTRIGMMRVMDRTSLQASLDPLTGLLNRRAFENQTSALVQQGRTFAIAMADLDEFKQINDVHGHDSGDRAIRAFGHLLQETVRSEDLVCRYGGEEFVVLLPNLDIAQATSVLERVQMSLLDLAVTGSFPSFTASFGVADSSLATDLTDVIRLADLALLRSKRDGRNRITSAGSAPDGDTDVDAAVTTAT